MDCSELCCLASVDGVECKKTFDTYDDFEEHFCQKHLNLTLFACGAKGCTAQFGTVLQIFRHLAICKRRGKKIKLLQCSNNAMESLTSLDRAKLLAVQCCVKRAKRVIESDEINSDSTADQDRELNAQCSLNEVGFHNSLNDDKLHVPIIKPFEIHQVKDVESRPNLSRRERAITPARQAAKRLREQIHLEKKMMKNRKSLGKSSRDAQKTQKKLPVKITDKTRISALINDDPKQLKSTSNHLRMMESDLSRDFVSDMDKMSKIDENIIRKQSHKIINMIDVSRTVDSDVSFKSAKQIVFAKNRPKLLLDETQNPVFQKQPRIFESSLPAGPDHPPKIYDVSRPQLSFGLTDSRIPDYSEFVINPTPREISPSLSSIPPSQIPTVQASNETSQPAVFPSSQIDMQLNDGYIEPHGILRTKDVIGTMEQTGQMDFDILSLFSKSMQEFKTHEHFKISTLQAKQLEQPSVAEKQSEQIKSMESSVKLEKKELSRRIKGKTNFINLSLDNDYEGKEDDRNGEDIPTLLNLFSDKETAMPVLFDPRIIPKSFTLEKKKGMCSGSNGYYGS
ncbi:Transcription factor IIIA [Dirofilaria immitis]